MQRRRTGATPPRDAGSDAPAQWPRRRRLGRRRRYNDFRRSSRLHSFRSVLGLGFLRHQSLQPHAPGSSPQHVRCLRHRLSAQKRNDPTKSHCARRTKSLRARDGRASHSSSVSRPGKLRVGRRRAMAFSVPPSLSSPPGLTRWSMLLRQYTVVQLTRPFGMDHRVKPGDDESFRCRDAASHPSFAHAKKSQAKKHRQKTPPLKEGRRSADRRMQDPHRKAMRRASFLLLPLAGGPRPRTSLSLGPHGAGALAFRRPTAASEVLASARLRPRFLEPPDANGRTLSGTSAASTSQSGTRRTGRCPSRPRAQCIAALDENRSRSALRSTLAKGVPLRAGFWLGNRNGDESQGQCRFIGDTSDGGLAQRNPPSDCREAADYAFG